jgi:hypothetical protein
MNKRYTTISIITGLIVTALIAGGFAYQYYNSFKKVSIVIQKQDITADVYMRNPNNDDSGDDTKVGTVKSAQVLSLQPAKYYAVPEGDKYDNSQISFTVSDKNITIVVNPGFSSTYLTSQLTQELSAIKSVITTKYPTIINGYTINTGKLYLDGSWYGTTLVQQSPGAGQSGDVYRTVLHKVNGTWQFIATPELVLTAPSHSSVPESILSDLNSQTGY